MPTPTPGSKLRPSLSPWRILVTGGAGRLARRLAPQLLARGAQVWAPPRGELDLLSSDAQGRICAFEPNWIIHAAGFTDVEGCERDPAAAMAGNVETTRCVVEAGRTLGCRGIFISTDYVFGGGGQAPYSEGDDPNPVNVYGESKRLGELLALEAGWAVARVAWLYGDGGGFEGFIRSWQSEAPIPLLDQVGTPTHLDEVGCHLGDIVGQALGIYHLVGRERVSRLDWARQISRRFALGADFQIIEALPGAMASRPRDSSLVSTRRSFRGL